MRVPGRRPIALALAGVGSVTTMATIVLSVIPAEEEPHKGLVVTKILLSTTLAIDGGVVAIAKKKRRDLLSAEIHAD